MQYDKSGRFFFIISFLLLLSIYPLVLEASLKIPNENSALFSARVSKLNRFAKLMRIKIDFENAKYFSKKDQLEFWNETYPDKKCRGFVEGRSSRYILIKIPNYKTCITRVHVSVGTYLHLYSSQLEKKLAVGKELVEVLLKKRLALISKVKRLEREMSAAIEKVETVNERYEVLRQKLELEWKNEISALEEDKTKTYSQYKYSQAMLNDLDYKLQLYRVKDQNLKLDRWSLDPKLYFKK